MVKSFIRGRWIGLLSGSELSVVLIAAMVVVLILVTIAAVPSANSVAADIGERYLSPIEMALSPDGRLLYVVCEASGELRVVDLHSSAIVATVAVGNMPRGIVLTRDGRVIYVSDIGVGYGVGD